MIYSLFESSLDIFLLVFLSISCKTLKYLVLTLRRTRKLIPHRGTRWGGGVATPPLGFCGVTTFGKYFTSNR